MEWNKTKSIFIVAFLILDIFLGYQFFQKWQATGKEYEVIKNDVEHDMKADHITYEGLNKEATEAIGSRQIKSLSPRRKLRR